MNPRLPVRLEDDGSPARPAAEVLADERELAQMSNQEAQTAIDTAIECFLRLGDA